MLHELIRQGRSFSGHERHCCFLNLRDGQFADISSVSGLDFSDDGRAAARVDWDRDGDLDVWIANRSGPQVRFLRNDVPHENNSLVVQLQGRTCNRDAIGARVELIRKGQDSDGPPLWRSLSAGDGFLAQSSKELHFGLGDSTEIDRLRVRWPGGEVEEFSGLEANGRYLIVQQSGRARRLETPTQQPLAPSELSEPPTGGQARVLSAARLPLPRLEYETFDGDRRVVAKSFAEPTSRPVILNLWASWCTPCLRELKEWTLRADELRAAGVDVIAISVDGLDPDKTAGAEALRGVLGRIGFPFDAGLATAGTVDKLQMVQDHLFDAHRALAVPTTFLLDRKGNLAATYRGTVDLDRLLADVQRLKQGSEKSSGDLLSFAGRWHFQRPAHNPFHLVWQMVERGFLDESLEYIERHKRQLTQHYNFHKLLVLAGNGRLTRGEARQAAAMYREALEIVPSYVDAQNNLAWLLSTHPDDQLRNGADAVRLAEAAIKTAGRVPSLLDTLAAAYAEVGRFDEAVATATEAIRLAVSRGQPQLSARIKSRLPSYEAGQPWRDQ
jgi:thiol-disulfide isomerase/thioredoxin